MIRIRLLVLVVALTATFPATAQDPQPYSRRNTYSIFTEYSNTSSHIILGVSQNRRLISPGVAYSRRLLHRRLVDWNYVIEALPLNLIQEPNRAVTSVVFTGSGFASIPPQSGPAQSSCTSGTFPGPGFTFTQVCSTRWSYTGGISPLGQRFSFVSRHRLQPFLIGNAGFLAATHDIPSNDSRSFNFTFEFGTGLEFFQNHTHSWSAEYRIHHLSNAYTARNNPGIDNQILKLTYSFGR